jgi:hypothetical protein
MSVQLSYGGISWRLPKRRKLKGVRNDLRKAMKKRSPLTVTLDGGETLIINGAGLGYVLVFDDKSDPSSAPASLWNHASVTSGYASDSASAISASPGSVISTFPGSVISTFPGSVISTFPGSVISSGTGSVISSGTGSVISGQPISVISWWYGR